VTTIIRELYLNNPSCFYLSFVLIYLSTKLWKNKKHLIAEVFI